MWMSVTVIAPDSDRAKMAPPKWAELWKDEIWLRVSDFSDCRNKPPPEPTAEVLEMIMLSRNIGNSDEENNAPPSAVLARELVKRRYESSIKSVTELMGA